MANLKLASTTKSHSSSKTVKQEYKQTGTPISEYQKFFLDGPKAPVYYYPTVKTDSALLNEAKSNFDGLYDTYIANSKKERDFNLGVLESKRASVNPLYDEKLSDLELGFKKNDRSLLNSALKSGMGRSSYILDMQKDNRNALESSKRAVENERKQRLLDLDNEIEKELLKFENSEALYNAKRDSDINKQLLKLQKERDKELFDAQKYNNQLYQNYLKLVESTTKHNLNVQKYIDSINMKKITVTTTTRSSTSSTYKPVSGVDRERVEALWQGLSGDQKIQYMRKNGDLLLKGAPDLYSKYSAEALNYGANSALDNVFAKLR